MSEPEISSVIQSTTLTWSGTPQSAELAIDGDMETASHTNCAWNTDIWYKMRFDDVQCFDEVEFVNSYLNYNAFRMQDLGVYVKNSDDGEENLCEVVRIREDETVEGQTYMVSCDGKCGDSIVLRVRHDRGKYSYMACIHLDEIKVHYAGDSEHC